MNTVDIVIFAALALAAVMGLRKGIIRQLGSVAAIFLAIAATRMFARGIESGLIIFGAVFIGTRILALALKHVSHAMNLGLFDRLLGAIFTVVEWALIISLILNIWVLLFPNGEIATSDNSITSFMISCGPEVLGLISSYTSGADSTFPPA